ncbi:unnamed protein product [Parnassius apollo]|uniref:(apollo) hypothetical protein n=1 Tax=Parnassius apollo TaxID=110799 RepID=A0A8S3Y7H8_PARAO|nr:unnamed protein product [Parnassius apollo]
MFDRALFLTLIVVLLFCEAENSLLSNIAESTRQWMDDITKLPIVQQVSKVSGDVMSQTTDVLTKLPLAVARSLDLDEIKFPMFISDSNVVELTDQIINEFNVGLDNKDITLNMNDLVTKYGYPIERHQVTTKDGYVLSMYRIPNNGSVVFLMHGLLGSSDDFVVAGPESGLAYLLSTEGYDVWMGNSRGNKHSRQHLILDPSQSAFWDFSWHEIGCYDLPAMIDYVLQATKTNKLKYVGHSQGTTSFFVMASEKPEYNSKISLMVALSPVAFMTHVKSPLVKLLAPGTPLAHSMMQSLGVSEVLPHNLASRILRRVLCGIGPMAEIICSNLIFLFIGFDFGQLNVTNLPVLYSHIPSGASVKQFAHYGQGVVSGDFRKFDYGDVKNLDLYGSNVPPSYNLENIIAPVSIFYSEADWFTDPRDVHKLYRRLGNVIELYKVPYDHFSHLDFIIAKDFKTLIYSRLRKLLRDV